MPYWEDMFQARDEVWCDPEGQIWLGYPVERNRYLMMINCDTGEYFENCYLRSSWRWFGWKKLGMVE